MTATCFLCDFPCDHPVHGVCSSCQSRNVLPQMFIGICGRARNGKDYTGGLISKRLAARNMRIWCGAVSGQVLAEGVRIGRIKAKRREDCDKDDLNVLVSLGHERRVKDEDHWLRRVTVAITDDGVDVAIVPGIRFPNEVAWIKQGNGVIVKVTCYNPDGSPYISPDRDPNDPMETMLDRLVPDYGISAFRGQTDWLAHQANTLTDFLSQKYLTKHYESKI